MGEEGLEGQEGTQRLVFSTLLFSQKEESGLLLELTLPLTHLATLDPFSSRTILHHRTLSYPTSQTGSSAWLSLLSSSLSGATSAPSSQNQPVKK